MKSIKNNTLIWLIVTLSIIVNVICYFTIPSYHRYYYLSNSLTDDMNTTTPLTKKKLLILAYGRYLNILVFLFIYCSLVLSIDPDLRCWVI